MRPGLKRLQRRGERAFAAWVRRSDDRRLDRVAGSGAALRLAFTELARRLEPRRAGGFQGDIVFELRRADGRVRAWTVAVSGQGAQARPGPVPDPALRVIMSAADFARLAARELEPGTALLAGRLDVHGDFATAARLGEMFGFT